MFRTTGRFIAALILVGVALPGVSTLRASSASTAPGNWPVLSSSFVQAAEAVTWSDATWDAQFDAMAHAGIKTVLLDMSVVAAPVDTPSRKAMTAYYPTGLEGFSQAVDNAGLPVDVVGGVLENSRERGMRVWLGLGADLVGWYGYDELDIPSEKGNAEWLAEQAVLSGSIASEILDMYPEAETIEGWFFPGEDTPWGESYVTTLHDFYVNLGNEIDAIDSTKKLLLSPFYHPDGGRSPAEFTSYLEVVLEGTSVDVVALQTCAEMLCGPKYDRFDSTQRSSTVSEWLAATALGVERSGTGAELWANVELFGPSAPTDSEGLAVPFASVSDVVDTMRAAAPYVSSITSWSYTNQWSPHAAWGATWWSDAYENYVQSGEVDLKAPTPPQDVTSTVKGDTLAVEWATPQRERIAYIEVLKATEERVEVVALPWNDIAGPVDVELDADADYFVRTRTAAGARSPTVLVHEGGRLSADWAHEQPYTSSRTPAAQYPDTGSSELTDGVTGDEWSHPAWQGYQGTDSEPISFVVDLGTSRPVRAVSLSALSYPVYDIYPPSSAAVAISADGKHWVAYGEVETIGAESVIAGLANARYVRMTAESKGWLFVDELVVTG